MISMRSSARSTLKPRDNRVKREQNPRHGHYNGLMHPDFVAEFIREFHAELNRQRRDAELTINFKRREFEETCRKLAGLIEAIADGFRAPGLQAKLDELERSKARLQSEIEGAPAPSIRLHPNLAELYRKKVVTLQDALVDPVMKTEALEILRSLINRVSVSAGETGFTRTRRGDRQHGAALRRRGKPTKRALSEFGKGGCGGPKPPTVSNLRAALNGNRG
jgi:hypothetical protein